MTLSESTHPYPAIAPCPDWCRTSHAGHSEIHESAIAYVGNTAVLLTAYARCFRDGKVTVHLYAAEGLGDRHAGVELSDAEDIEALGDVLEMLAGAGPEAIRELAAQARRAALIAGAAS